MNKPKFFGKLDELKEQVRSCVAKGSWSEEEQKVSFHGLAGEVLNWWPTTGTLQFQGTPQKRDEFQTALLAKLGVQEQVDETTQQPKSGGQTASAQTMKNPKVFIVHGHDKNVLNQLELRLRRLGVQPLILQSISSQGETIIEALEHNINKEAAFGIVLMTPDDVGYSKDEGKKMAQPRARQNVILEMGMLMGRLGRKKVVILKKGTFEAPSDADGILYIPFKNEISEIDMELLKWLTGAGLVCNTESIKNYGG